MKVREMTSIAVMAAMICAVGPFSIAIGPIPLSLASFAVYMAGAVLGAKKGTWAVGLYLLIGVIGVPVFSGFSGGFQKLAGMTGGYLLGYLPCAYLTGIGARITDGKDMKSGKWVLPAMMAAGTFALYLIGTAWFLVQTGNPLLGALSVCVLPFLPGDGIKIMAAPLLAPQVRRTVELRTH